MDKVAEQLSFIGMLDENKTLKNVEKLLKSYRRLVIIAGAEFEPKVTATYSFEPRNFTGVTNKPIENYVIRKVAAQKVVEKIEKALNGIIDAEIAQAMYLKYCQSKQLYDYEIYNNMLHISETEFYRRIHVGKMFFAERYDDGKLQVYKK